MLRRARQVLPAPSRHGTRSRTCKEAASGSAGCTSASGAQGVLKFLDACYRTHTACVRNTRSALEGCMAQDYMYSQVLAAIYAKVAVQAPEPNPIAADTLSR